MKRFDFNFVKHLSLNKLSKLFLKLDLHFPIYPFLAFRKPSSDRSINYWIDGVKKDMKYVWSDGAAMVYSNLASGRADESSYTEGCVYAGYSPTGSVPQYAWWQGFCSTPNFPTQYICKGQNLNGEFLHSFINDFRFSTLLVTPNNLSIILLSSALKCKTL